MAKEPLKIITIIKIGDKEYAREERDLNSEIFGMTRERQFQLEHYFQKPAAAAAKAAIVKYDSEQDAKDS